MKKSIFLFFAALLCSVSAWADVTWKGGYFYFDNSLDVNKGYVMLCGRRHKENGNDNDTEPSGRPDIHNLSRKSTALHRR
mgnify:CR=1 FL=1